MILKLENNLIKTISKYCQVPHIAWNINVTAANRMLDSQAEVL